MQALKSIFIFLFEPKSTEPADRYREMIIRVVALLQITLGPIAVYISIYVADPPLPSYISQEFLVATFFIPALIVIYSLYRGHLSIAIWAFMIGFFLSNQRGVLIDGYWDFELRLALVLELLIAAFVLRTKYLLPYAIAQMITYTIIAVSLEGSWYFAPEFFEINTLSDNPESIILPTITFHVIFTVILGLLKIEFDRRQHSLQNIINNLEDLVVQRTAELEQANSELTEASQAKDRFVSNVSHELRTPITSISLNTQVLQRKYPNLDNERFGRMIRDSQRLSNMIDSLLLLSQIDQDRVDITLISVDVCELLKTLVQDRQFLAKQKNISLTFQTAHHQLMILGDPALIEQVFSVLITNALNYTFAGGTVVVRINKELNDYIAIEVADTGVGVKAEDLPKLFERFYRGDQSKKVSGTGLGLAIAHEIVIRHRGSISVSSAGENQGTTFTVKLKPAP